MASKKKVRHVIKKIVHKKVAVKKTANKKPVVKKTVEETVQVAVDTEPSRFEEVPELEVNTKSDLETGHASLPFDDNFKKNLEDQIKQICNFASLLEKKEEENSSLSKSRNEAEKLLNNFEEEYASTMAKVCGRRRDLRLALVNFNENLENSENSIKEIFKAELKVTHKLMMLDKIKNAFYESFASADFEQERFAPPELSEGQKFLEMSNARRSAMKEAMVKHGRVGMINRTVDDIGPVKVTLTPKKVTTS